MRDQDRKSRTQAAWNASLNHAAKVGPAAATNAEVEACRGTRNETRGTPVPPPISYVVTPNSMADGKVVRIDDRKATYGGEIIEGNIVR